MKRWINVSIAVYCRIIVTSIVGMLLFSCSPQVTFMRSGKSYPPREDNDSVVIYRKAQNIPVNSEKIGTLQATCFKWMEHCDSASVFSLSKTKIKKAGGNAFLITKFEKPTFWNNSNLSLNGDVFLVHDFSSPPDTLSKPDFISRHIYVGVGLGPETGLSLFLPKVSYYNFQERKKFETYYGIESTLGIINTFWMSLDCLYGIKKSIFSFDTSIGLFWYPKDEYKGKDDPMGPYFHTTINPKIGFKIKGVWLKAGPSVYLYKKYPKEQEPPGIVNTGKIGNSYYNFEILIKL